MSVASDMNSNMSTTWVQLASLLSLTPNWADRASPLAQMPLNPACCAILADTPLCASRMNSSWGDSSKRRNWRALLPTSVFISAFAVMA